jgi:dTDP-4-amino-4,6-dideoxygalactose transaminase
MASSIKHSEERLLADCMEAFARWIENPNGFGTTSQITGAGAVGEAERQFSALHGDRPALLTASATYGIRCALKVSGVGAGDSVIMSEYDWPASYAAALSLGAIPRLVSASTDTLTLDPGRIPKSDIATAKAVCVTHIYGTPADVPAIRKRVGDSVAIIEDCAQALGCALDGRMIGTLESDYAVFSFGPGKQIDVGEAGMILAKDWNAYDRVLRETQHPVRQLKDGLGEDVNYCGLSIRPHPLAAILLLNKLAHFNVEERQESFRVLADMLQGSKSFNPIGIDKRRRNAQYRVPVTGNSADIRLNDSYVYIQSGAFDLRTMQQAANPVLLIGKSPISKEKNNEQTL